MKHIIKRWLNPIKSALKWFLFSHCILIQLWFQRIHSSLVLALLYPLLYGMLKQTVVSLDATRPGPLDTVMNLCMSAVISYILNEARHEDYPIICDRDLVAVMKIISPFIILLGSPTKNTLWHLSYSFTQTYQQLCTTVRNIKNFLFICLVNEPLFSTWKQKHYHK